MRPVTPDNKSYVFPDEMKTNTAAIKNGLAANKIKPTSGKTTFDTRQVLGLLDKLTWDNNGTAKWAGLNQVNQGLVISLITYFTNNDSAKYGRARGALIDNYGQYCSYCGMPVQDTALAIEHCMPKSVFPGKMINYDNFFLCCPSCNSYKGDQPDYAMSKAWAVKYINPAPNFQQIIDGGFARQLWPNYPYAWAGFPPYLWDVTNKQAVPLLTSYNLNGIMVNIVQNMVQGAIPGYNNDQPFLVAALMNTNNFTNPILQIQEDNFIDIIKLNDSTQGVYSDRRVTNRTVTWFNILASLKALNLFKPGSGEWKIMQNQIFSTAKNAGYFEIWASLFYAISPPAQKPNSVYLDFRTAACDNTQILYYFPGTNAAQLPTT